MNRVQMLEMDVAGTRRKRPETEIILDIRGLNLWYGEVQALHDIKMAIRKNR